MKISAKVHPNAKKQKIKKDASGMLHIYVNQPPIKGKANRVVIEALARYFNTKKNRIFLVSGAKSKTKTFEIQ